MFLRGSSVQSIGIVLVAVAALTSAPKPVSAAAPDYSLMERAKAIATPSLVFFDARYEGFFRDNATGENLSKKPTVATFRCSGFVVNADGYVVSSGHCVKPTPDMISQVAAYSLASEKVSESAIAADQVDSFVAQTLPKATFTSTDGGDSVRGTLYGQMGVAVGGLRHPPAIKGEVVVSLAQQEGDVALVKLAAQNLPVIVADNVDINPSSSYFTAGYVPGEAGSNFYTVNTRTSRIVGMDTTLPAARYRMDGDLGHRSHGGLVFDFSGRGVGMINGNVRGDKLNRLITDSKTIKMLLDGAGITNALNPADQAYRAGLDAYFSGRYAEAVRQFDKTLSTSPANGLAASYRQQAAERHAVEGDTGEDALYSPLSLVVAVLAGALVVVVAVAAYWLLTRRRRSAMVHGGLVSIMPNAWSPISAQPFSAPPDTWLTHPTGEHPVVDIPTLAQVPTPQPPQIMPSPGEPHTAPSAALPPPPAPDLGYAPRVAVWHDAELVPLTTSEPGPPHTPGGGTSAPPSPDAPPDGVETPILPLATDARDA